MSTSQTQKEQYYSSVILKGLKAALAEASIEQALSKYDDGHIKLNKLMYVAAAEFDLLDDLQHSWHIYGSDLGDLVPPPRSVRPAALDELPRTPFPPEPSIPTNEEKLSGTEVQSELSSDFFEANDTSRPETVSGPRHEFSGTYNLEKDLPDEEDFYNFFKSVEIGELGSLNEILETNRVELLEQFYTEYVDDVSEFSDLYLLNVKLQALLDAHEEGVPVDRIGDPEYELLNQYIRELREEFYKHSEFKSEAINRKFFIDLDYELDELFNMFLDLLDDVYFSLSRRTKGEFRSDLSHIFSEINAFYHEYAWNLVTKTISLYTRRGPRQERLINPTGEDLRRIQDQYHPKFASIVAECESANLLPIELDSCTDDISVEESLQILKDSPSLLD